MVTTKPKSFIILNKWLDFDQNMCYNCDIKYKEELQWQMTRLRKTANIIVFGYLFREVLNRFLRDSVFGKPVDPVVKRGRPKGSVTQAFNDGQDDENKTAVSDVSDDDGFVDPNDLFARQEQNRRSGQSIANLLNNR